jgi:predicted acylesterase/phospholipase RssA
VPLPPPRDPFLILAVDGGGVRGVIPAMLLQDLTRTTGLRVERLDLLAGTSAGSLLTLGLAGGVSVDRITGTFQSEAACRQIFTPNDRADLTHRKGLVGAILRVVERLARGKQKGLLGAIDHLLNPRYTGDGLKSLIEGIVAPTPLDKLPQRVFAPALCLDTRADGQRSWRPTAFHNMGKRSSTDGFGGHAHVSVIDAVLASSAAPVDFPPRLIDGKLFVDGGTIANNPSALALAAAVGAGLVGEGGVPLDRVRLLSLGTGVNPAVYPPSSDVFPPPFGGLGWMWPTSRGANGDTPAFPLTQALQDSSSQAADYQALNMLPAGNYRRVQIPLGEHHIALDDATAVPELEKRTRAFIASEEWSQVRRWVAERFTG